MGLGKFARSALALHLCRVPVDLGVDPAGVPSELGCHEFRGASCGCQRVVAGEDPCAGAARQHVGDASGHLVSGGEHRLGSDIGEPVDERVGKRRVLLDHGHEGPCLSAVA